jgi:hypothetical protein
MAMFRLDFTLKREIDLGQILTAVSVLLSFVALAGAWNNDRLLREKEYADRVRRSASVVTAKIERWAELSGRYFEDLQPTLVDVSERVARTHATQPANRFLYKGLMEAKAKSSQRIVDEQLQIAYMELYGYVPAFQDVFDTTIQNIKSAEAEAQQHLRDRLQNILRDPKILSLSESPLIGNALREEVEKEQAALANKLQVASRLLRDQMIAVVRLSDAELRSAQIQTKAAAAASQAKK